MNNNNVGEEIPSDNGLKVVQDLNAMRKICLEHKRLGSKISLVATMGALHEGHLQLVKEARLAHTFENVRHVVVVSVFVNPRQFDISDDYLNYPKTLQTDFVECKKANVDFIFAPLVEQMYPPAPNSSTCVVIAPDHLGHILEGKSRPGHFSGMLTIVTKLLNIVQPDDTFFGEKDYQQLLLVTKLVADLNINTVVNPVKTVRDEHGLALSSRNKRLNEQQRQRACIIFKVLSETKSRLEQVKFPFDEEQILNQVLCELNSDNSILIDYFELRCAKSLDRISCHQSKVVCGGSCNHVDTSFEAILLIACRVDNIRLIDNMKLTFNQLMN